MSEIERKKALRRLWKVLDKRTVSPVSRDKIIYQAPIEAINELAAKLEADVDKAMKFALDNLAKSNRHE